jgi:D-aminopeptidase
LPQADGGYTVGVLVQANHGRRHRLSINGVPVGLRIGLDEVPAPRAPEDEQVASRTSSIIIVVATDAPLLPHQCDRLAQRAGLGVARTGGVGEHSSGDLFFCFSVANRGMPPEKRVVDPSLTSNVEMLADQHITPLFDAVVETTEEAIVNALLAAETMVGRDDVTAHALDPDRLLEIMSEDRPARPAH